MRKVASFLTRPPAISRTRSLAHEISLFWCCTRLPASILLEMTNTDPRPSGFNVVEESSGQNTETTARSAGVNALQCRTGP